jgi:hypothetical protein
MTVCAQVFKIAWLIVLMVPVFVVTVNLAFMHSQKAATGAY